MHIIISNNKFTWYFYNIHDYSRSAAFAEVASCRVMRTAALFGTILPKMAMQSRRDVCVSTEYPLTP